MDNQLAPEDILEEIILDDNDNILPDDLDDSDYNPEDDDPEASDDDIIVEGEEGDIEAEGDQQALDAIESKLEIPASKLTHAGEVYSLQFNPVNPQIFASGSGDDTAKLWNLDDLSTGKSLTGHTDSVVEVQFSPDGQLLASCGLDALLKLWDLQGNLVHTLEGPTGSIDCCAWHPRGPGIVAGGGDGSAWLWETKKGDCVAVFSGHADAVTCVAFSSDGKRVVTGSADCTVRIWDPKTGKTIHTIKEGQSEKKFHEAPVTALKCYTNDLFVTGGEDGFCSISDSLSGKIYASYEGHNESIECIEFVPSLNCCATGSLDKTVQLFDLSTANQRSRFRFEEGVVRIKTHAAHPNLLFVSTLDGCISLWDYRTSALVRKIAAHAVPILDIAVSNGCLLSGAEDSTIKYWKI